jgi:dipeptidyl aminopeptidase/acylaminoacyl peptidase
LISWRADEPGYILLNWWEPDENGISARKVNVHTGRMQNLARARLGMRAWFADHLGAVRAGSGATRWVTKTFTLARRGSSDHFEEIVRFDPFSESGFEFASFSEDPNRIYVWSDDETGRQALYSYELSERKLGKLVFGHPDVDAVAVRSSDRDGRLASAGFATDRWHWHFFDRAAEREQAALDRALPNANNQVVDTDRSERTSIVLSSSDRRAPVYYIFRRNQQHLIEFSKTLPDFDVSQGAEMRPVRFSARDGLTIHGYLTIPKGAEPRRLPAIVFPHGGPSARDVWGWNAEVQFLASLGFAVLQPNFRGSPGYGTDHRRRGYKQWGLAMQDDIEDGTRWLISQGIADPQRIGIYGASYGGYAALMALVKTPDLFRAGASLAGVTDIVRLLEKVDQYVFSDFNGPLVGDSSANRD